MSTAGIVSLIRAWFEDNIGTHAATDAAVNAALRIADMHRPGVRLMGDDEQEICMEDGQDFDSLERPGCDTLAAVVKAICEQDPSFASRWTGGES